MSRWMRFCTSRIEDIAFLLAESSARKVTTGGTAQRRCVSVARSPLLLVHGRFGGALAVGRGGPRLHRHHRLAGAVEPCLVRLQRPALPLARERRAHLGLRLLPRLARFL